MSLLPGEKLEFKPSEETKAVQLFDNDINEKYIKGDVRIVTEQARYPLPQIAEIVESDKYELNPIFQRRPRWSTEKQSRLIESLIMNVPIPPIFLYEYSFAKYEVMDGLQRLTAIHDFYRDKFALEGLEEWPELIGRKYSELPEQIKAGIDRRYISSVILLQETAKSIEEAQRLKQLVFERINSGGEKLEYQESRNAVYDGPLNQLCIKLSRNVHLCKTWGIPEPTDEEIASGGKVLAPELIENSDYKEMNDVELVLRFFAHRQRHLHNTSVLRDYFDNYLKYGNKMKQEAMDTIARLFAETIKAVYEVFGDKAFWLWQKRSGTFSWYSRATTVVYDPLMYVMSQNLAHADQLKANSVRVQSTITEFYEGNSSIFEGRKTSSAIIQERQNAFNKYISIILGA
jgi:hypothetical protein